MVAEDERVAEEEHSLGALSPCTVLEFQEQTKVSQKGPFDLLDDPDMFPECVCRFPQPSTSLF